MSCCQPWRWGRLLLRLLLLGVVVVGGGMVGRVADAAAGSLYPAFFIFGDSLVDVGNNNYIATVAKANTLPYGIDFPSGPTGRFTNGKTVTDLLCESLSLPLLPPYLAPTTRGKAILQGVNYASAGGGIVRLTGVNLVGRVDMDTQISWFGNSMQQFQQQLGGEAATQELLGKALFSTIIGSNDYINNYLLKGSTSSLLSPTQFQQRLLSKFSSQLTALYNMGARNILVFSIGPIGCIPSQLAARSVNGECSTSVNNLATNFNEGLKLMLSNLTTNLNGSQFMYADVFEPVYAYRSNPEQYGFKFGADACCGSGRFNGQLPCLPVTKPCSKRSDYIFWDPYHPTEGANKLIANLLANKFLQ